MVDVQILQGGDVRAFVQSDGISPANAFKYFGRMQLDGVTQPQSDPDPVYNPSTTQRDKWDIVDRVQHAQELGSSDFTQRADRAMNDEWWEMKRRRCLFNMVLVMGRCQNPSDPTQWDAKLAIVGDLVSGDFGLDGTLNALNGGDNAEVNVKGTLSFTDFYPIYPLKFSPKADATITTELIDGLYFDSISCGDCGPVSDGRAKSYYLAAAATASPGLSGQIIYSLDDDNTYTAMDINTLAGLSANRMAVVGSKLVVVSQANNAQHVIDLTDLNAGIPNWGRVATGYVATKGPRAIWSKNAAETWIAAAGGYIYFTADPTSSVSPVTDGSATTQDLNDIHGKGKTIVAVGGSNAVLVSIDGGLGFTLITGPTPGIALNRVWVNDTYVWWVGTANGKLFYSLDQGATWNEKVVGAFNAVNAITFVDSLVGYLVVQSSNGPQVYRTTDGGFSWQNKAPSLSGLPSTGIDRYNFAAVAGPNKTAIGGRVSAGGDGKLYVAE